MEDSTDTPRRGRLRLLVASAALCLALDAVLRTVLYGAFHDGSFDVLALFRALVVGASLDVCVLAAVGWLAVVVLAFAPTRLVASAGSRAAVATVFFAVFLFLSAVEFFFFQEFDARFNHIALDYLVSPHEVFVNIWESYPVVAVVAGALVAGGIAAWTLARMTRGVRIEKIRFGARIGACGIALVVAALGVGVLSLVPSEVTANRITSEVSQNGIVQLARAFFTAELDYEKYYATLPRAEARKRAARVFGFPTPTDSDLAAEPGAYRPAKEIGSARGPGDPLDVVVVLEESLGSEFIGVLGSQKNTSPGFDRWSKEGLLLTNLVANGNRTVRGLEGVLCSFVPLPGDSITKRPKTQGAATIGAVFASRGYDTCFLYGGVGLFDWMKPFARNNGWAEFVEQSDYPDGAFTTAWGVADEYIFDALVARHEKARADRRPLFATVMSVSNHKPYLVPDGRVARPDSERSRDKAAAYADWALAHWLDTARAKGLLEHTLVLLVGDHGARVYGKELIPVGSYRIPALYLVPGDAWRGKRIDTLCSQVDLAPTLLSLAGIDCRAPFLGHDLTRDDSIGRAFVHHNRDIGILTDDVLVVLGLKKSITVYTRADKSVDVLTRVADDRVTDAQRELARDAMAVFQTADELYQHGAYVLPHAP